MFGSFNPFGYHAHFELAGQHNDQLHDIGDITVG